MSYKATDWADGLVLKKVSWEGSVDKRTGKKNSISPCVGLQKLVLLILCKRMNDKTKRCFPSLETLIDVSGLSKPTVINCIKALEIQGIIKIERGKISNEYLININSDFDDDLDDAKKPESAQEITEEQLECWEWAKNHDYWQDKVSTQLDFLKAYKRQGNGVKGQYEAFKSKSTQSMNRYEEKNNRSRTVKRRSFLTMAQNNEKIIEGEVVND